MSYSGSNDKKMLLDEPTFNVSFDAFQVSMSLSNINTILGLKARLLCDTVQLSRCSLGSESFGPSMH